MSRNPSGAAIKRDDAAHDESSPHAVTVSRQDLADLAAMLARVEALVATDATAEQKGSDSLERIADIAFVLHERDVEASLCDALDAAVREISAVGAGKEDRARRSRQATQALRELLQRVNDMIAAAKVPHRETPGTQSRIGTDIETDLEADLPQPAASRGGSLPLPAPAGARASHAQREAEVVAALPPRPIQQSSPVQQSRPLGGQGPVANVANGAVKPGPSAAAVTPPAEPADASLDDDDLLLPPRANEMPISNEPVSNEALPSEPLSASPNSASPSSASPGSASQGSPSSSKEAPLFLNPEDDPGDLFEPTAGMPPHAAPEPSTENAAPAAALENGLAPVPERSGVVLAVADAGSLGTESLVESSSPPRPLRFLAPTVPSPVPRSQPTDPLAPVRALSDEEMIALFS